MSKKTFIFFRRLPPPPKGEWGGLEKLMFDWFERIDYQSVNACVAVTKGWKERFQQEAQKRNLPLTVIELTLDFDESIYKQFIDMKNFLNPFNPDGIVFFQGYFAEFTVAQVFASSLSAKGNVFMHENLGSPKPPERTSKKYLGFLPGLGLWWHYNRLSINLRGWICKKILVVSDEIKKWHTLWWGYPQSKILVAYHGVNTKHFSSSQEIRQRIRSQLNINPADIILITTARFTNQKRLERAISSFGILSKEFNNIHLVMAGTGPLLEESKKLAYSLKCKDRIKFLGQLNDPSEYLKASDIFVLSSDNEGLSLALLEAMSTGLICLSTNCTGSNEAITSPKTGWIVEKTVEGITVGLREILLLSQEKREKVSQEAMRFVRTNFDIDINVQKVFKTIGLVN